MGEWLVIALRGPFASFADEPGNTTRKTSDMPTRSALLGLAAAALGIRREDAEGQRALGMSLVTASALLEPGSLLTDFHTFQSLNQAAKGATTRAAALRNTGHVETSITRRDYRTDALWQGAYRRSGRLDGASLHALAKAFRQPHFALYVGRRACPLSHPLNPKVYDAADVRQAFIAQAQDTNALAERRPQRVSLEDRNDAPGANHPSQHRRRDDPLDRSIRWTFGMRTEWRLAHAPEETEVTLT